MPNALSQNFLKILLNVVIHQNNRFLQFFINHGSALGNGHGSQSAARTQNLWMKLYKKSFGGFYLFDNSAAKVAPEPKIARQKTILCQKMLLQFPKTAVRRQAQTAGLTLFPFNIQSNLYVIS